MVGRWEEGPLCDPGSELLYWEGGREARKSAWIIDGMEKKNKKKVTLSGLKVSFCPSDWLSSPREDPSVSPTLLRVQWLILGLAHPSVGRVA